MSRLEELGRWLRLLDLLRPMLDTKDKSFNEAWSVAYARAAEAAAAWAIEPSSVGLESFE